MLSILRRAALTAVLLVLAGAPTRALEIQFDYTYDTGNFFVGHRERQLVLEQAAQAFESRLVDPLTEIKPGDGNTWAAVFFNPATGGTAQVTDLTISAGVVKIYAGARDLSGGTLGIGGPGGYSAGGTQAFLDEVAIRGQAGAKLASPTDFGPWGGSITFDIDTAWYFDPDVRDFETIGSQADFYSVAVHELAHTLGFGTAASWSSHLDGFDFTGSASTSLFGGAVPLSDDRSHWAEELRSNTTASGLLVEQDAAMDPAIAYGTRKYFTELDYAGLADVGWQVIPEPSTPLLVTMAGALLISRRRALARGC